MRRIVMALALFAFASCFALAVESKEASKAPQEKSSGLRYELSKLGHAFLEKARGLLSPTPVPSLAARRIVTPEEDPDCGKGGCHPGDPGCGSYNVGGGGCPDPWLRPPPGHGPWTPNW